VASEALAEKNTTKSAVLAAISKKRELRIKIQSLYRRVRLKRQVSAGMGLFPSHGP
jgi:hypothetical protein